MSTIIIITPPPTKPNAQAQSVDSSVRVIGDDDIDTINDAISALADYAASKRPED